MTKFEIKTLGDLDIAFEKAKALYEKVSHLTLVYSTCQLKCEEFNPEKSKSQKQNSLLHVWFGDITTYQYKGRGMQIGDAEQQGMKRWLKLKCYADIKQEFLVKFIRNPHSGDLKTEVTSTADWNMSQTHHFMEWLLQYSAEKGLVLECTGEFLELAEKQNA